MKYTIRDFNGVILGTREISGNGDEEIRNFHGQILSRYRKSDDTTRDYFGRIITYGNTAVGYLLKDIL